MAIAVAANACQPVCPELVDCALQSTRAAALTIEQGIAGVQLGSSDACTDCCGCTLVDNGVTAAAAPGPISSRDALCDLLALGPEQHALPAGRYQLALTAGDWIIFGGAFSESVSVIVEPDAVTTVNSIFGGDVRFVVVDAAGNELDAPHFEYEPTCG